MVHRRVGQGAAAGNRRACGAGSKRSSEQRAGLRSPPRPPGRPKRGGGKNACIIERSWGGESNCLHQRQRTRQHNTLTEAADGRRADGQRRRRCRWFQSVWAGHAQTLEAGVVTDALSAVASGVGPGPYLTGVGRGSGRDRVSWCAHEGATSKADCARQTAGPAGWRAGHAQPLNITPPAPHSSSTSPHTHPTPGRT